MEESFQPNVSQVQFLAPAVGCPLSDGDQAISLQGKNVPAKGRPVHDHLFGKAINRQRTARLIQLSEDRELGYPKPRGC